VKWQKKQQKSLLAAHTPFVWQSRSVGMQCLLNFWEVKVEDSLIGHADINAHTDFSCLHLTERQLHISVKNFLKSNALYLDIRLKTYIFA
jgi:hypothetical protein